MKDISINCTIPAEVSLTRCEEFDGLTVSVGRLRFMLVKSKDKEYTEVSLDVNGQEASSDDWHEIDPDFVFRPENLKPPEKE